MSKQTKWTLLFCGIIFCFLSEKRSEGKRFGCFDNTDHGFNKAQHKVMRAMRAHRHTLQPVNHAASTCVDFLRELSSKRSSLDLNHRSLAPWRTRTVENQHLFPAKYEVAECLCDGCIINGVENNSYNSVPVEQTRLFLKKVMCPSDPSKYSLEYEYVKVTVACTCAVPRS